jgi:hypothetical protein
MSQLQNRFSLQTSFPSNVFPSADHWFDPVAAHYAGPTDICQTIQFWNLNFVSSGGGGIGKGAFTSNLRVAARFQVQVSNPALPFGDGPFRRSGKVKPQPTSRLRWEGSREYEKAFSAVSLPTGREKAWSSSPRLAATPVIPLWN